VISIFLDKNKAKKLRSISISIRGKWRPIKSMKKEIKEIKETKGTKETKEKNDNKKEL
jgi:hypothetical protein